MKKFRNTLIATVVASSLAVTPVLATPSVNEIKNNKAKTEQQLQTANNQLVDLLTAFETLKEDMAKQEVKIEKADKDLKKAKEVEEKQYQEMLVRIKYMYEKGEESEATALLGATSFGEMMNQAEYIQSVHSYDRKMLNEYKKSKEKVANLKSELESGKADMEFMADTYEAQEKELKSTIATMKEKVADFDSQLAEAQREAEEEARRLAEQTRKAEQALQKPDKGQKPSNKPSKPSNKPSNPTKPSKPDNKPSKPSKPDNKPSQPETPAEKPSNTSKGQQIANTGLKYVGNPYVYGGNSLTNGIDCSGFTQQIHKLCGINGLPRSSSAQRSQGKAINGLSNALPGDVICYSGHVAIYLGGNQIVHASNPSPYPKGGIKTGKANYRTILAIRRYW